VTNTLAFIPGERFPSISITGNKCWLNCDYCRGRFLRGMDQVYTPKQLYDLAKYYTRRGVVGLLISGGFTPDGYLPVKPYLGVLRSIKKDFNLVLNIHPGLIDHELTVGLRDAGVDIVDYEFMIDNVVIKKIKHLVRRDWTDYVRTYEDLLKNGPPYIAPHILIGARYGSIGYEYRAIDLLREYDPYITVFLVLIPDKETPMRNVKPPGIPEITNILEYARRRLHGEISMGCMRPPFMKNLLDEKLLERGLVDRIVNPHPKLIRKYGLRRIPTCCSLPREILIERGLL
jgi:uncharacterized radical SAM superfamily protein